MSWWAIAAQALGSALSSRSSNRQQQQSTRQDREFLERQSRFDAAQRRAELEAGRRWDLEDTRRREEAIGGFRRWSTGNYGSPAYTDTNPSRVEAPVMETEAPEKPKPRKKAGLLGG